MCLSPIVLRQCDAFVSDRMPPSCLLAGGFCCSLAIAAGFLAVYLLITYLIAFAFELLWILEASAPLPTAAALLCTGYFTLALFAALLIHGLATKHTLCLIAWLFAVTVLTFPEAGMVIYMSIQYWRIESLYGITELTCWLARILANVIAIVVVQSLYSAWKEEEMVAKGLRDLRLEAVTIPRDTAAFPPPVHHYPFYPSGGGMKRATSSPQLFQLPLGENYCQNYQFATASEFNAAIFMPPQLFAQQADAMDAGGVRKAQSLGDLRVAAVAVAPDAQLGYETRSLGRQSHKTLAKCDDSRLIRNRSGFYARPIENYGVPIYYGPLDGPDFLIYKKQVDTLSSKNSLSNASAEDVQKYRDVAL